MSFYLLKVRVLFHAAAYKHVPLVELNPLAAILNNSINTRVVCNAALASRVDSFVLISTDKAVRPSNVISVKASCRACCSGFLPIFF